MRFWKHEPAKYENFRAVKSTLEEPLRIFAGVRVFNKGGWCYTGRPKTWYVRQHVVADFPKHLIFADYLNPAMYVYEFRAEVADRNTLDCPENWQERYEGVVWKRNTS